MLPISSRPSARPAPLARAAYLQLRAKVSGGDVESNAIAVAKTMRGGDDVLHLMTKGVAPMATTDTPGFAEELIQTSFGQYLGWLAPGSAAARMFAMGLVIPNIGHRFSAPARNTAPATMSWVGEGMPIPAWSTNLAGVSLQPRKMGAISVITREVAKNSGESVITALLREDGERSLDAGYFSTAAGDDVTHPGLLAGQTSLTPYAGGDLVAFQEDIGALLAVVAPNGSGNIVFVTGAYTAQRIALKFPDFRSPVLASPGVADTRIVAVDAGALVHAFGDFDIEVGRDAVVHMDTEPEHIVSEGGVAAGASRSLFQTDSMGIRILGDVAFAGRKPNVAAFIDGMNW